MSTPFATWLTARLLALSTRTTPRAQRAWAEAMRAESHYLPAGAKLRWASGCLLAAIKLRFAPMQTGTFRINRWVMLVEVFGCFLPALLAWWEFAFGPSGLFRLNAEMIQKFMTAPGSEYIFGLMIGFSVTGLVAPIGLFLGLRYVMLARGLNNRVLGFILVAAPVLQSFAATLVGIFVIGVDNWGTGFQIFVLFTVLPVAGILHLMYLAKPAAPLPADARLAAS